MGVVTVLTGCVAVGNDGYNGYASLSSNEKDMVKSGSLVKITQKRLKIQYKIGRIDPKKLKNGVYVCAARWEENTDCYPKLSAYIGKYFADRGVKLADSPSSADMVIKVGVSLFGIKAPPMFGVMAPL